MNVNVNGSGRCSKEYWEGFDFNDVFIDPGPSPMGNSGPYLKVFNKIQDARDRLYPIYQVGDRVWVREMWRETIEQPGIMYRADGWENCIAKYNLKWKASIYMPKKYARIWREITEVRIKRVQEISSDDISAEGMITDMCIPSGYRSDKIGQFADLWDSINGERGYPWENNDWVIALTLREIDTPSNL